MVKETIPIPELNDEIKHRFLSKIAYTANPNCCWEWQANTSKSGYGKVTVKGITILAQRMAYYIHTGIDPIGSIILHTCDNRKCVNPNHLSIGTHKDNSRDMIIKGRGKEQFMNGEKHKNAKLTEDIVREIRRKHSEYGLKSGELALMYGICQPAMSRILSRKRWSHI